MNKKTSSQIADLSRLIFINFWKYQKHINMSNGFLPTLANWLKPSFIWMYIKAFFYKCSYPIYKDKRQGIFKMPNSEKVSIALVSDWATDTIDSDRVGFMMRQFIDDFIPDKPRKELGNYIPPEETPLFSNADYTIHLGDVYYLGTEREIDANFGNKSSWPYGKKGSFALSGNHEMYSGGDAFYHSLLKKMGTKEQPQEAGFFCLENDYWRVIALDTGYNSVGIPWINKKFNLTRKQMDWLKNTIKMDNDNRGIVFLSHHQYFSAFEKRSYPKTAIQIAELLSEANVENRSVLWFWGHEHRLAFYDLHQIGKGVKAFGRCIGHGSMPQTDHKFDTEKAKKSKLLYFDAKQNGLLDNKPIGRNGYVRMKFLGDTLDLEYIQIENTTKGNEKGFQGKIVTHEQWSINLETGKLYQIELATKEASILNVPNHINQKGIVAISYQLTEAGFYEENKITEFA
jgi:hypothetical protein